MMLDAAIVREHARYQWGTLIFPALGIEVHSNPRKHTPCPVCGGRDRFRCDDKDGRGTWFCNQCNPRSGDGFALVTKHHTCSFPEALQLVAGILGLEVSGSYSRSRPAPKPPRLNRIARAFEFELAAFDRRIRADKILDAAKALDISMLSDDDLDNVVSHVGRAYADRERAELFETVADGLRAQDFFMKERDRERITHDA